MRRAFTFGKKHLLLVFLAVAVVYSSLFVCSAAAAVSEPTFAATYQANPTINWPNGASYTKPLNPFTVAGWGNQCTAFAWGRAYEVTGTPLPFRGNANTWYTTTSSLLKGAEPHANSIAVWAGDSTNTAGHVAYIEEVVGDVVSFSEANIETFKSGGGYDGYIKKRSKSLLLNRGTGVGKLLGYLYLDTSSVKSPASLKTVTPNGGERWTVGSTQTITWSYSGDQAALGGGVKIEVLRGNDVAYTVPASIIIGRNGTGTFSWIIPSQPSLPPESTYKVRIVSSMNVSDVSDQTFTLVGPRAVVSADLKVKPSDSPTVSQMISGTFTIANRGNADLVMNKLTIGGLLEGGCPDRCPDFGPMQKRTLRPGQSYMYSGLFIPRRSGIYTFSVAYQKPNNDWVKPVDSEKGNVNELKLDVREWKFFGGKPVRRGSALISWFNDDDKKKIPLILIHGIHESDELSVITNKGESWKSFVAKFNGDPYLQRTYTLYAFQYYSNQDGVEELAKQLGQAIDNTFQDRPHVFLAHSMGGLIAKSYMTEYPHTSGKWSGAFGGDTTLLLITLATPHHGTPGANDASAMEQYMGRGWSQLFGTINFMYWSDRAGFLSPPSINSGTPNRSDLRWDNYDGGVSKDFNFWLGRVNREFAKYSSKAILYAGALKLIFPNLTSAGAFVQIGSAGTMYNDHQRLEFANESMVYGLDWKFGTTDGMVPYNSSLLCDKGPFIGPPDPNFLCLSPTRVRRFEPGSTSVLDPQQNTLSI